MTMKVADAAPEEAQLIEIAERLSEVFSEPDCAQPSAVLDLDPSFLQTARDLLGMLEERSTKGYCGAVQLTKQQIEHHLEFSPDLLDAAKAMLRDFIERMDAREERRLRLASSHPRPAILGKYSRDGR